MDISHTLCSVVAYLFSRYSGAFYTHLHRIDAEEFVRPENLVSLFLAYFLIFMQAFSSIWPLCHTAQIRRGLRWWVCFRNFLPSLYRISGHVICGFLVASHQGSSPPVAQLGQVSTQELWRPLCLWTLSAADFFCLFLLFCPDLCLATILSLSCLDSTFHLMLLLWYGLWAVSA